MHALSPKSLPQIPFLKTLIPNPPFPPLHHFPYNPHHLLKNYVPSQNEPHPSPLKNTQENPEQQIQEGYLYKSIFHARDAGDQ